MRPDGALASQPRGRFLRLQTQVGLVLGGLAFITAVVLAAALSSTAERRVLDISAQNLENLSAHMARELSAGMDTFSRDVQDQAVRDRFTSRGTEVPAMRAALDQFKQNHPEFVYVSIVDVATKRVIAANGGIFEGGDAGGRPTFEQGKLAPYLGDVHEAVRLAELLPKPVHGETLRFLDVAAPIRDASGKVFRVFASHVGWDWTASVRDHVFGPIGQQRGVDAFLVDTFGKVVMSRVADVPVGTDLHALTGGSTAARRIEWPDRMPYLTAVAVVAPRGGFTGFGWKVVARQPYAAAFAPARDLRNAFMAGAVGLGLIAALLAWLAAGRLTRPVRTLADAVRTGQGGSLDAVASTGHVGEVHEVARAMTSLSNSARRQAEAAQTSERQFAVLAGSLPQVVWETDSAGRLQYVNKGWLQERLGASSSVADLAHVIHLDDCDEFNKAWRVSVASGDPLKVRCRLHLPETPQPVWHDVEARAVKSPANGEVLRWVGTMFDVNESVLAAEHTEQRLAQERTAREEAERLSRMRDEFMATVSHELRSPLSAITGWSDILARKANADETLVKAAQVIRRNAMLQAQLIDDLLDMTAVMAGKLTLNASVFDLAALAKEVTLSHLHAAQQKGVALICADAAPAAVRGDGRRVSQVLSNLIGNAIKFTDAGGRVEVSLDTDAHQAAVKVQDTGRGISANFLPHVFERLRQEDGSKSRKAGGLGIGLAIAKAVVELHGGTIRAHSEGAGAGSEFTFILPLAEEPTDHLPPDASNEPATETDLSGMRVLLVDDERDAREVGQIALASMGAHVTMAPSAPDALHILERERFDLLVSDIGMPGTDGLAFLRSLRASSSPNANIAAVALSAFALESEQAEGIAAGFDAYVTKPISLRRLGEGLAAARKRHMSSHAGA